MLLIDIESNPQILAEMVTHSPTVTVNVVAAIGRRDDCAPAISVRELRIAAARDDVDGPIDLLGHRPDDAALEVVRLGDVVRIPDRALELRLESRDPHQRVGEIAERGGSDVV